MLRPDLGLYTPRVMTETGDPTPTPETWVGRKARLRYVDADVPRWTDCTIVEVNNLGVSVEVESHPAFFPWGSVVRIDPTD